MSASLVVFGFTGDLVQRKLMPALLALEADGRLPDGFEVVGISRRAMELDDYFAGLQEFIGDVDDDVKSRLMQRMKIAVSSLTTVDDYRSVVAQLDEMQSETCRTRILYIAVPPTIVESIVSMARDAGMHNCADDMAVRLLIEKPFGHDLASAEKLAAVVEDSFGLDETYLIDHYMAKDTAQNIMHFRFYNPLFDGIWNNQSISNIQISATEMIDIEGRANFYEQTGALRDMFQAHMMSLLNIVTMEEPEHLDAENIVASRKDLLDSIRLFGGGDVASNTARAQYNGYRDEVENQQSNVETFAALRLEINNNTWRGVPIYIKSGKAMDQKTTEVNVVFKDDRRHHHTKNVLTFRIQPSEGIAISLVGKKPGLDQVNEPIMLDYCYDAGAGVSDAYERIINDAIKGERSVFPTVDEMLSSWRLFDKVLADWAEAGNAGLEFYDKGAAMVDGAGKLAKMDDNQWHHNDSWVCTPKTIPREILEQLNQKDKS